MMAVYKFLACAVLAWRLWVVHLGPARTPLGAGPIISTHHLAFRNGATLSGARLDDAEQMRRPSAERVALLLIEAVQIVGPRESRLTVREAQLGDVRRDAERRQAGAKRPPAIVQRPRLDRLAAVELGDAPIEALS